MTETVSYDLLKNGPIYHQEMKNKTTVSAKKMRICQKLFGF